MINLWKAFTRRKPFEEAAPYDASALPDPDKPGKLKRCLGTFDLTALGIGSTLGIGIYVIIGTVAAKQAGPSVVLSFAIASVSSIFAGLCYAEFGARVPKAGSAYVYSYICVGELMAFVIGWNLILEYVIGSASVARGYSDYVDYLFNNKIHSFFLEHMRLPESTWFASYPDLFAFCLTMLLAVMLMIGVQESTRFNTIFTGVNFAVIIFAVAVGLTKVNVANWSISPNDLPVNATNDPGKGGFFPFGVQGMVSGAATCFYSYVGFDAIATTGEEVINPQRAIPISIVLSLSFISLAYCSVATIQTMLWPYYDQNQKASLPYVFDKVGYSWAKDVITIGAIAGLSTSLLGAMFPLPRILYAMANDGLLFGFFAKVSPRFKTPAIATMVAGLFSALMAMFFDVDELAEMMSIGTLLAYSLVAISILILRYQSDQPPEGDKVKETRYATLGRMLNLNSRAEPDWLSSRVSMWLIALICLLVMLINLLLMLYEDAMYKDSLPVLVTVALSLLTALCLLSVIILSRQPMTQAKVSFKIPLVPFIPLLSILTNAYLMIHLNHKTWFRFIGWLVIGFVIYFSYGIGRSVGHLTETQKSIKTEQRSR